MNDDESGWLTRVHEQNAGEAAYTQLRQRYQGMIRSELHRRCLGASHHDLEDLEAEVWILAWRALPRFQGRSAISTWLVGVARNVAGAWLRHRRHDDLGLLRLRELDGGEREETNGGDPLARVGVQAALNHLPEREHEVIELRYFQELADQGIAQQLHLPLGTVKGRIRRGLNHLRKCLIEPATR